MGPGHVVWKLFQKLHARLRRCAGNPDPGVFRANGEVQTGVFAIIRHSLTLKCYDTARGLLSAACFLQLWQRPGLAVSAESLAFLATAGFRKCFLSIGSGRFGAVILDQGIAVQSIYRCDPEL